MAGIYLHIPYCKQKCHYCNFYTFSSTKYRNEFVNALIREIDLRKNYIKDDIVNTIYFGGGTPSILNIEEINKITDHLKSTFSINPEAEITLEANPDDLDFTKLQNLKSETQINRLSIGIQSFFDDDLKYLNRVHNGKNATNAIENSLKAGFDNITIDLIYGIPGLTEKKWKENLRIFFDFNLNHLSSYSLTVEPKTVLNTLIKRKKLEGVNEEESIKHFKILLEETEKNKFIHYEISNFARESHYSKHNSIYWLGGNYCGFGPSAHSFNGVSRQWNVANMKAYIESENISQIIFEKELLTPNQQYNEYVMTSLRTSWGCDLKHIENTFGKSYVNSFTSKTTILIAQNKMIKEGNIYRLSNMGKLFADGIAADFFIF